jgi:hypothetical protein
MAKKKAKTNTRDGDADQKAPAIAPNAPQISAMPAGSRISGIQRKTAKRSGSTRKGSAVQCMEIRVKPTPNAQVRMNTALPHRR